MRGVAHELGLMVAPPPGLKRPQWTSAWDEIVRFYCKRLSAGQEFDEVMMFVHKCLFNKVSKPIVAGTDAWGSQAAATATAAGESTDATQPAATISVVVPPAYAAEQVMKTIQTRGEWLDWYKLPHDYVLRDETDQRDFLHWVRGAYENTEQQLALQERDFKQGGQPCVREGKQQRWGLELQRRCGSEQLWELVSFTGRFETKWLWERLNKTRPRSKRSCCSARCYCCGACPLRQGKARFRDH